MHPLFFDSATLIITKSKADTRNFSSFGWFLKKVLRLLRFEDLDRDHCRNLFWRFSERKCKDEHCPGVTSSQSGPLAALLTGLTSWQELQLAAVSCYSLAVLPYLCEYESDRTYVLHLSSSNLQNLDNNWQRVSKTSDWSNYLIFYQSSMINTVINHHPVNVRRYEETQTHELSLDVTSPLTSLLWLGFLRR